MEGKRGGGFVSRESLQFKEEEGKTNQKTTFYLREKGGCNREKEKKTTKEKGGKVRDYPERKKRGGTFATPLRGVIYGKKNFGSSSEKGRIYRGDSSKRNVRRAIEKKKNAGPKGGERGRPKKSGFVAKRGQRREGEGSRS